MSDELAFLDALAQAELVRRGEVSPVELVDAAIERIEALNPHLNALVWSRFEEARDEASRRAPDDAPFTNVPMLTKDLWGAHLAGMPRSMGNVRLRDAGYCVPTDERLGTKLRAGGLITLGTTNTPEFGMQTTTQPLAFGPTGNPWALDRSTSGSSGGAAAAVASGMVPIAHGSDSGGSIRLPAGWCGVVGLKPSRGRTAYAPTWTNRLSVGHVLTRTVRDTAAALDAVCGNEPGDLYLAPAPSRPYRDEVGADPGRLRIGVLTESPLGVDSACIAAADATARLLESLGHHVEAVAPPDGLFDPESPGRAAILFGAMARGWLRLISAVVDRPVRADDVEPFTWALARPNEPITAEDWLAAHDAEQGRVARLASWWANGFDVLVTPTAGERPAPLDELTPNTDDPLTIVPRLLGRIAAFTSPFNLSGQPAISVPLWWTDDSEINAGAPSIPVGVQLVAALGREDLLIRVAAQLEAAHPWKHRRPPTGTS